MSVSPTNTVAPGVESGKPTSVNFRITPTTISDFTITFYDDMRGTDFTLTKSDFTESNGYLTRSTSYYIYSINISSKDIYKTVNMSLDDSSSPNILTIEFANAGPEKLYAWTDPNPSSETLYAWDKYDTKGGLTGVIYYTASDNPVVNDPLLDSSGKVIDSTYYYVGTTPSNGEFYIGQIPSAFKGIRNTSEDIISQPATLYTDSTTLTSGMTLYDNTGTDISLKVSTISGNSFDIQSAYLINFVFGGELTNYSIDETTYTNSATISLTEGNHILTVTTDLIYASISSNYNGLVTSFGSTTGSTKTCTLNVSASGVKVVENNYELGPISSTLTVSGSSAGGSN